MIRVWESSRSDDRHKIVNNLVVMVDLRGLLLSGTGNLEDLAGFLARGWILDRLWTGLCPTMEDCNDRVSRKNSRFSLKGLSKCCLDREHAGSI